MIHSENLPPDLESELVIAAISLDRSKDERISQILGSRLDWSQILHIAIRHGVFPLCFMRLMTLAEKYIPPYELEHWKELLEANTQNNIRLTWKLIQCEELLAKNGIDCITLKGPVLALQAYGDITLRKISDLDILVHPTDFPKVYAVLEDAGYSPDFKLDRKQIKYLVRTDNHFSFNRKGDPIEVHWGAAPQENIYPITEEQIWLDLISIDVFDRKLNSLSLENSVIFTCLHGAKHGWRQLKWIADVAYLSRSLPETSWLNLIEHAKTMGFFRQVCLGLFLSKDLVCAVLPSKVEDLIKLDNHTQQIACDVRESLFKSPRKPSFLEEYLFYLDTRERLKDRIHFLIDLILKPKTPDWRLILLPEKMYFLYYLIRPIRLLLGLGKARVSDTEA